MNWYVASLLRAHGHSVEGGRAASQCQYLIAATSHDEAYEQAAQLGAHQVAQGSAYIGIVDLLLIHDPLADGVELLWSESEISAGQMQSRLVRKENTRAFREGSSNT